MKNQQGRWMVPVAAVVPALVSTARPAWAECAPDYVTIDKDEALIMPTGSDDTENFQCVFDALSNIKHSKLEVAEGNYTIKATVGIRNYDGKIEGAGMGRTIIGNDPEEAFPLPGGPSGQGLFDVWQDDDRRRELKWSDMTLQFQGDTHEPWRTQGRSIVMVRGRPSAYGDFDAPPTPISTAWDQVEFIGEESLRFDFNTFSAIHITGPFGPSPNTGGGIAWWPLGGDHVVKRCVFDTMFAAIDSWYLADSKMVIGGSPKNGNVFINVAFAAVTHDMADASVEFSYNLAESRASQPVTGLQGVNTVLGMYASGPYGPPARPSTFVAAHNTLTTSAPGVGGIAFVDYGLPGEKLLTGIAVDNEIVMESSLLGIYDVSQGSLIAHNVLSGTSSIWSILAESSIDCLMVDNDVAGAIPEPGFKPIGLAGTQNCTVVSEDPQSDVQDLGIGTTLIESSTLSVEALLDIIEPKLDWMDEDGREDLLEDLEDIFEGEADDDGDDDTDQSTGCPLDHTLRPILPERTGRDQPPDGLPGSPARRSALRRSLLKTGGAMKPHCGGGRPGASRPTWSVELRSASGPFIYARQFFRHIRPRRY